MRPLLVWFALASTAFAQSASLQFQTTDQTLAPEASSRQLELRPMRYVTGSTVTGTTQSDGEHNDSVLGAYYADAGNWEDYEIMPRLGARGIGLWNGFTIGLEGMRLSGGGLADTRSEVEFSTRGGGPSRLVALNPSMPYLLYSRGLGLVIDGVNFYGRWHPNNGGTLKADTANFANVGLLVGCQNNGIGAGKIQAPAGINFSCFKNAIQLGDTWYGDNADQLEFLSLRTLDCDVGIHSICRQSVGHTIVKYEGTRCKNMLYFERGGEILINQACMQNVDPVFLRTRANLLDDGTFRALELKVDGSVSGQSVIWQQDPYVPFGDDGIDQVGVVYPSDDEGATANCLYIDFLKIVVGVVNPPRIEMREYSTVHIKSGVGLRNNMIRIESSGAVGEAYYPTIIIENCIFSAGHSPANIVDLANSVGVKWKIIVRNCWTLGGENLAPFAYVVTCDAPGDLTPTYTPISVDPPGASVSLPLKLDHRIEPSEFYSAIAA